MAVLNPTGYRTLKRRYPACVRHQNGYSHIVMVLYAVFKILNPIALIFRKIYRFIFYVIKYNPQDPFSYRTFQYWYINLLLLHITMYMWWLGIDLFSGKKCACCLTLSLDPLGHHALTCRHNGDVHGLSPQ